MIITIGMVKNEADIIEAFVRHNLHYVDSIHLIENGSTDATPEILQRLQDEGLPLHIESDPTLRYNQSERTTKLYHKVLQHRPTFVIPLDADEFIQAPSREYFHKAIQRIPPNGMGSWLWRTCLPTNPSALELEERFPLARRYESPQHGKAIIRVPTSYADPALVIEQGSHNAIRRRRPLPGIVFDDIHIAHLPVRTIQQLTQKVILGWMANTAQFKTTSTRCAWHWGELYEKALELTADDLIREAYAYSQVTDTTKFETIPSNLRIEGLTTRLNCDSCELDFKALLRTVCSVWQASLVEA